MKKISLLIITLLVGFCALGQVGQKTYSTTTPTGTNSLPSVNYRYSAITPDSLNQLWLYNPLTARNNRVYTATEVNKFFAPISGGFVPYTGATADLNLGNYTLIANKLTVTGTAGNGFINLPYQSSAPTTPTSSTNIYAASTANRVNIHGANGYVATLSTQALNASQSYSLPDNSGLIYAAASNANGSIPYATGGTTATSLPIGTNGYVLGIASGLPSWRTPAQALSDIGALSLSGGTLTGTVNGTILNLSTNLVTPEIGISSAAYLNNNVLLYGKNFANTDYKGLIGLTPADKVSIDNGGLGAITGGNLTVGGAVSATNLSGTNTGDQTNITGNAGTASLAANSTLWGTHAYPSGYTTTGTIDKFGVALNGANDLVWVDQARMQTALGYLPSSGFTTSAINTLYGYTPANGASYLPLTGGNLSGNLGIMKSDPDEVQMLIRNSNGGNKNLIMSSMSAGYGVSNWANNAVIEATNSLVLSAASATGKIFFQSNGRTNVGNIDASGVLTLAGGLANGTTATTQTPGDNSTKVATTAYVDAAFISGTYTPTITSLSGTTVSITAYKCQYTRVGNVVTVFGRFDGTRNTGAGNIGVTITLPIASNLVSASDLNGLGNSYANGIILASIIADTAADTATFATNSMSTGLAQQFFFSFSYEVL